MAKKDSDKTQIEQLDDEPNTLEEVISDVDSEDEEFEDEEHEDDPSSLSARILRVLSILAIGAVGALWAGPKLAPMLPVGLKPVAEFLAPQANMTAKIAGLKADFENRIAAVEAGADQADTLAQIQPVVDGLKTKNADLAARVANLSKAAKTLESGLAELQAQVENMTARQALTSQSGQVSEETLKQFEKKLAAITAAQQKLNNSQNMAVDAQQDAEGKLRMASAIGALAQISDALETGASFQKALDMLGMTPPADLADIASSGTPPLSTLKKQFPELARTALREDATAHTSGSTVAMFTSFLKSQIGTRSLEPQQGDSLDAVLSRIEAALEKADLQTALAETTSLTASAKQTMGRWITSLTHLNAASEAVQVLQQQLTTTQN